jgi:hypothetical protein
MDVHVLHLRIATLQPVADLTDQTHDVVEEPRTVEAVDASHNGVSRIRAAADLHRPLARRLHQPEWRLQVAEHNVGAAPFSGTFAAIFGLLGSKSESPATASPGVQHRGGAPCQRFAEITGLRAGPHRQRATGAPPPHPRQARSVLVG